MLVENVSPYIDFSNNCMCKWEEKAGKNQSIPFELKNVEIDLNFKDHGIDDFAIR